jgi:hypothetical protein
MWVVVVCVFVCGGGDGGSANLGSTFEFFDYMKIELFLLTHVVHHYTYSRQTEAVGEVTTQSNHCIPCAF